MTSSRGNTPGDGQPPVTKAAPLPVCGAASRLRLRNGTSELSAYGENGGAEPPFELGRVQVIDAGMAAVWRPGFAVMASRLDLEAQDQCLPVLAWRS